MVVKERKETDEGPGDRCCGNTLHSSIKTHINIGMWSHSFIFLSFISHADFISVFKDEYVGEGEGQRLETGSQFTSHRVRKGMNTGILVSILFVLS